MVGRYVRYRNLYQGQEWYGLKLGDYDKIVREHKSYYELEIFQTINIPELPHYFELMPENWTPNNNSLIDSIQIW